MVFLTYRTNARASLSSIHTSIDLNASLLVTVTIETLAS